MTITPGPTMASRVFSLAGIEVRVPVSFSEMVPSAPLMSPTWAESRAAPRAGLIRLGLVVVVTINTPFATGNRRDRGERGQSRQAQPWGVSYRLVLARSRTECRCCGAVARARARNGQRVRRAGPIPARSIVFHDSPPSAWRRTKPAPQRPAPRQQRRDTCREDACPMMRVRHTSLVRALALHGVARPVVRLRSHLASPLRPGRGVLIRSVSRRLGSVACVREDASPNEVSLSTTVEDARSGAYMSIRRAGPDPKP